MSNSAERNLVKIAIDGGDAASEIFVIDWRQQLVARGIGKLETVQVPGIYKIRVRTGLTIQEQLCVARGEIAPITYSPLPFSTANPLPGTARTHEYHIAAAAQQSQRVHVKVGQGSAIFVFVRDWTPPQDEESLTSRSEKLRQQVPSNPASGLLLKKNSGDVMADLEKLSETSLQWDPWAACCVQVDPGVYRLSLQTPLGELEQSVVAAPAWQTQVFLLQRNYGREASQRRADLAGGAIAMSASPGFAAPYSTSLRLAELARVGLATRRRVLSNDLREILRGKFYDPMLGICGAHLMLLDPEPDMGLFEIVVSNLRGILGIGHPDVEALALRLPRTSTSYSFALPPMLRRSWSLILEATLDLPMLVPRGSLAERVAERVWAVEPWLIWTNPDQSSLPDTEEDTEVMQEIGEESPLEAALKEYLWPKRTSAVALGIENLLPLKWGKLRAEPAATMGGAGVEAAAGMEEETTFDAMQKRMPLPQDIFRVPSALTPEKMRTLVQSLGVTRLQLEDLLRKLGISVTEEEEPGAATR